MALKCDFRRFLRYGVKFDIGALLTSKFLAVWRFIIFRQQEGMCTLPRFSPRNKKPTSEKDKNKPQNLGRFEIFFRGLIATF
ncbi:hypothetical protein C3420_16615 [Acinetobacter sp. ACNIH3]|nr:hypothetical protein C3420_16615 [Acinetobacter sp. ACNIH3]POV72400.1 hypothetical protein C3421_16500 [Acinetobacter sp. ACNIH4]